MSAKDALEELRKIEEMVEAGYRDLAASLGCPNWIYRDLPLITRELMFQFIDVAGEDNLNFITFADYGSTVRGQVLISPEGVNNLNEYAKKVNNEQSGT